MDRQIRNAVDAGEGDLRVRTWRQRLAADPDDLDTRLALARYYKEMGFTDVALEHYRIAAAQAPQNAGIALALARILDTLGMRAEACGELQRFTSAHPHVSWEAWSWLGILQDEMQDYAAAELSHRAALRLRERSDALHNNLGYNLLLQSKNQEAAAEFRAALGIAPHSALARNNLAIALAAQPDVTADELRAVGDPAMAHNNLAAILIERGDYAGARHQVDLALGYNKDYPEALSNLVLIGELEGRDSTQPLQRFVRTVGSVLFGPMPEAKPKQAAGTAANEVAAPAGAGSN